MGKNKNLGSYDWIGIVVVVLVLLFLIAVWAFILGLDDVYQHQVAVQENTGTATATVTSTDVYVIPYEEGDDDDEYRPVVVYEYTVDGETYENDNVFPGDFRRYRNSQSWAEGIVAEYEVGTEATISYNPDDPGRAYIRNDGLPSSRMGGAVYALAALLLAVSFIRTGIRRRRQRTLIENTPTEKVRSLSVGPSEIKGKVVMDELEPISAPFSEDDCVVADYEVKKPGDNSWKTVEKDVLHTPFYVDDGTGKVLVRPDDATYELDPEDKTTIDVDSSERGPAPVQEFVKEKDIGSGKGVNRKHSQKLIKPGESVYVFGTVSSRDDAPKNARGAERLVIEKNGDDTLEEPMFMISDDEEKDLVGLRKLALWRLPIGGSLILVSFVVFLIFFGPGLGVPLPVLF